MNFLKRLGGSALLAALVADAAFGAALRSPRIWSQAVMTALPKAQGRFSTPAGRDFLNSLEQIKTDPARLERLLAPIFMELRHKRKGPKAIQKDPAVLVEAIDRHAAAYNNRAAAVIEEAGPLGVLIATMLDPIAVKNAREAETLLFESFPYLTPENRKGLGSVYEALRARAEEIESRQILQRAHNIKEELISSADNLIHEVLGFPPENAPLVASKLPAAYAVRNIAEEAAALANEDGASNNKSNSRNLLAEIEALRKLISESYPGYNGYYQDDPSPQVVIKVAEKARTLLYRTMDLLSEDRSLTRAVRNERFQKAAELLKKLQTR